MKIFEVYKEYDTEEIAQFERECDAQKVCNILNARRKDWYEPKFVYQSYDVLFSSVEEWMKYNEKRNVYM